MAQQKRRPANDRAFKKYKANNQRFNNKISKMKRHIKKHPNDVNAQENLKRVENSPVKEKIVAKNPNLVRPRPLVVHIHKDCEVETVAEQLSRLLGIPLHRQAQKKVKPKITRKAKKNVAKT